MAKGDVEDVGVYESDEGYVEKDVVEEGELDEVVKLSVELFFVCVFFAYYSPLSKQLDQSALTVASSPDLGPPVTISAFLAQ